VAIGASPTPEAIGIDLNDASQAFRVLQGREAWTLHGAWIAAVHPPMGAGIRARFAAASRVSDDELAPASAVRAQVTAAIVAATAGNTVLVAPTTPGPAPLTLASLAALGAGGAPDPAVHDTQRAATLRLTCVAGLAGAPVVVVPLGHVDGLPLGVALIGAPGSDLALLSFAEKTLQR
jgi:amidase